MGYEVRLDVMPDVFAWGWLLIPRDLKPGERRPVVVCQHGLEGLPEDTVNETPPANADTTKRLPLGLRTRASLSMPRTIPTAEEINSGRSSAKPIRSGSLSSHSSSRNMRSATQWLAGLPFVDAEPHRVLWLELRRQDGDARAGDDRPLLPLHLLRRLQ